MIYWNTEVNAPCCPGEIVDGETGKTALVQTDWDFPGVANTFGWSVRNVQVCPTCGGDDIEPIPDCRGRADAQCQKCGQVFQPCFHIGTDGTVDCEECGVTALQFIDAAAAWLRENDGLEAVDPGYFLAE